MRQRLHQNLSESIPSTFKSQPQSQHSSLLQNSNNGRSINISDNQDSNNNDSLSKSFFFKKNGNISINPSKIVNKSITQKLLKVKHKHTFDWFSQEIYSKIKEIYKIYCSHHFPHIQVLEAKNDTNLPELEIQVVTHFIEGDLICKDTRYFLSLIYDKLSAFLGDVENDQNYLLDSLYQIQSKEIQKLYSQKNSVTEQMTQEISTLKIKNTELKKQIGDLSILSKSREEKVVISNVKLKDADQRIFNLVSKHEGLIDDYKKQCIEYQSQIEYKESIIDKLKHKNKQMVIQRQMIEEKIVKMNSETLNIKEILFTKETRIKHLQINIESIKDEMRHLRNNNPLRQAEAQITELRYELREAESKAFDLNKKIQQLAQESLKNKGVTIKDTVDKMKNIVTAYKSLARVHKSIGIQAMPIRTKDSSVQVFIQRERVILTSMANYGTSESAFKDSFKKRKQLINLANRNNNNSIKLEDENEEEDDNESLDMSTNELETKESHKNDPLPSISINKSPTLELEFPQDLNIDGKRSATSDDNRDDEDVDDDHDSIQVATQFEFDTNKFQKLVDYVSSTDLDPNQLTIEINELQKSFDISQKLNRKLCFRNKHLKQSNINLKVRIEKFTELHADCSLSKTLSKVGKELKRKVRNHKKKMETCTSQKDSKYASFLENFDKISKKSKNLRSLYNLKSKDYNPVTIFQKCKDIIIQHANILKIGKNTRHFEFKVSVINYFTRMDGGSSLEYNVMMHLVESYNFSKIPKLRLFCLLCGLIESKTPYNVESKYFVFEVFSELQLKFTGAYSKDTDDLVPLQVAIDIIKKKFKKISPEIIETLNTLKYKFGNKNLANMSNKVDLVNIDTFLCLVLDYKMIQMGSSKNWLTVVYEGSNFDDSDSLELREFLTLYNTFEGEISKDTIEEVRFVLGFQEEDKYLLNDDTQITLFEFMQLSTHLGLFQKEKILAILTQNGKVTHKELFYQLKDRIKLQIEKIKLQMMDLRQKRSRNTEIDTGNNQYEDFSHHERALDISKERFMEKNPREVEELFIVFNLIRLKVVEFDILERFLEANLENEVDYKIDGSIKLDNK